MTACAEFCWLVRKELQVNTRRGETRREGRKDGKREGKEYLYPQSSVTDIPFLFLSSRSSYSLANRHQNTNTNTNNDNECDSYPFHRLYSASASASSPHLPPHIRCRASRYILLVLAMRRIRRYELPWYHRGRQQRNG